MRLPWLASLALSAACAAEVQAPTADASLPVALLQCPESARVGVPFTVDGSASGDAASFATILLRVVPGDEERAELSGTFSVTSSGIATAILSVTDLAGNAAEARCRFRVLAPGEDPGEPIDPAGPGEPGDPPPGGAVDLSGSFALIAWDRPQLIGGALDPEQQCAPAPHLSMVTMQQVGTRVSMTLQACTLSVPSVQVLAFGIQRTEVPDAFLDALPALGPIDVELGAATPGAVFAPATGGLPPLVLGAQLGSAEEELPTDGSDPRVRDDDGDGAPGASLVSNVGNLEVAFRRSVRAFSGVVLSSDEIDGSAPGSFRVDSETSMLFSLFGFFSPSGDGLASTFRMLRVDGAHGTEDLSGSDGVLSCADLAARQAELMARLPEPAPPQGCAQF